MNCTDYLYNSLILKQFIKKECRYNQTACKLNKNIKRKQKVFIYYTDKSIIYLDPELQETPELFTEVSFWPPEHRLFSMLWEETEKM